MNALIKIGVVTKTHGVKGALKIAPLPSFDVSSLRVLEEVEKVYFENEEQVFELVLTQFQPKNAIVYIKGVKDIDEASSFKGMSVFLKREDFAEEGEVFIEDTLNLRVFNSAGESLGVVTGYFSTKANSVLTVTTNDGKDVNIPFIDNFVNEIDTEKGVLVITSGEGYFDL